ncbi:MAG: glucosidase, partial [Chloroflexota bacterium]
SPPDSRKYGRNHDWAHLNNFDIISMPDKWEYPWYAGWDLAFHCIPLVMIDPDFAKRQLQVLTREWYMHPNGQLPAYEWAFGDVNPPVHAWATRLVYEIDAEMSGEPDRAFLEEIFQKMLLNFTWWVNRKDADGNNIFQGGFLGLDNISVFDRSAPLPTGGHIDQSDGTAWMAFFSLEMLNMAIELSKDNPVYESLATKFFEHFLRIAHAMASLGDEHGLWDEQDGFYYDALHVPGQPAEPIRVRSLVGLMPMIAVETIGKSTLDRMPGFARRMDWMLSNRPFLSGEMADAHTPGANEHKLLSIFSEDGLKQVLRYMLDETEFLSDYGIRSVSKFHEANPYEYFADNGQSFSVKYWPAESESGLFGGNSNWRGPIWFPINFLLIEALYTFHRYSGDNLKVEMPTGSGNLCNMKEVADELSRRLCKLFLRNEVGERPIYGGVRKLQDDPHWRDLVLFNEYFHGDNGAGLGASHQTGWTGLVAYLLQQVGGNKK